MSDYNYRENYPANNANEANRSRWHDFSSGWLNYSIFIVSGLCNFGFNVAISGVGYSIMRDRQQLVILFRYFDLYILLFVGGLPQTTHKDLILSKFRIHTRLRSVRMDHPTFWRNCECASFLCVTWFASSMLIFTSAAANLIWLWTNLPNRRFLLVIVRFFLLLINFSLLSADASWKVSASIASPAANWSVEVRQLLCGCRVGHWFIEVESISIAKMCEVVGYFNEGAVVFSSPMRGRYFYCY